MKHYSECYIRCWAHHIKDEIDKFYNNKIKMMEIEDIIKNMDVIEFNTWFDEFNKWFDNYVKTAG